jgi:hypothetical protein
MKPTLTWPIAPRAALRFIRRLLLPFVLHVAPSASAQIVTHGTIAAGGGGALLTGDQPAFQEIFRQRKDGAAGLEDFSVTRSDDAGLFRLEARLYPAEEDYRATARFEKFDAFSSRPVIGDFAPTTTARAGGFSPGIWPCRISTSRFT